MRIFNLWPGFCCRHVNILSFADYLRANLSVMIWTQVPEGQWFCADCRPKETRRSERRKKPAAREELEEESEEESEEKEEESEEEDSDKDDHETESKSNSEEDDSEQSKSLLSCCVLFSVLNQVLSFGVVCTSSFLKSKV